MAKAPSPVTSPPPLPFQPYNAAAPEEVPAQTGPLNVYDATSGGAQPWLKIAEGGACDSSGRSDGTWPGNGTSDGGAWTQT